MLTNAEIKEIRKLNERSKARREAGLFVTEGSKLFMEAPLEWVKKIYVTEEFLEGLKDGREGSLKISDMISWMEHEVITADQLKKISDTQTPQGILCVMEQPQYSLDDIIKKEDKHKLIMILEDIQDPGNLGTIFRTAEGAGASGIVLSSGCVDIYNPKTIRSTMGSIYRMPFICTKDLKGTISDIQKEGIKVYAAHLDGSEYYDEIEYTDSAFLIGNEGNGLTDETASYADIRIKIPMEGELESLNAAVAASILMYNHYISNRTHEHR